MYLSIYVLLNGVIYCIHFFILFYKNESFYALSITIKTYIVFIQMGKTTTTIKINEIPDHI